MSNSDGRSILFLSQYFPPETGAAPNRVKELCKRWTDSGCEVTVLTSAPDYPQGEIYDGYENDWIRRETVDGINVISTKTIPVSNKGFALRGLKFVWFMLSAIVVGLRLPQHDVVVATSPQPLTGPAGMLISGLKNSKFIFEVRDLWPESISSLSDTSAVLLRPLDWIIKLVYRRADRLVIVVRGFENELIQAGVDKENIHFHPNGVTPETFEHDESEWIISADLVSELREEYVVSYIGTIGRAHGLSVVLAAAEALDDLDVTFLLVGTGAEAAKLEAEAERRGLDSIRFVGRRPKEEVPDFLALSDLSLVHLRNIELFRAAIPSKMFEAMAARTPIALGVRGEAEQIVNEAGAGWVFEPEDGERLATCVRNASENPEQASQYGENGYQYVTEHFSWDGIATAYLADIELLFDE